VRDLLMSTSEQIGTAGVTAEEVNRAKQQILKARERAATDTAQRWTLNHDTGEIVTNANGDGGTCLTAVGDFNGARVINAPCNGSIAQRWFF